ncbi:A/G-specific adenine glycosylase [Tepidibacillus fermentans]|uniref:Adenine DNA glycosylase n=1 Tax=Tepidibacillus fermentans TaxID=1281767 RepID=A0A4R3KH37_9BACI|nr:A/G-specific adenine glycosylase [Tepidibacillus fermentans]TCS82580.1 A/G-specific DNA-adenine glycosylase [Tepidibacillus fermentans]
MDIERFQEQLLRWFRQQKRDLPWRKDQDPYHIWVSEIMLQQTRVETAIPYYEKFIEQFPTVEDLAQAKEEEVLKAWEGLGYYSRARNLHQGVKEVREKYGGKVPDDKEEILKIPGIGSYTAGAILSIAYGKKEPAVDGNVLRVFSRLLNSFEDISKMKTKKIIEEKVKELIPDHAASDFNQALMELGATVCTPKSPLCLLCPVMDFCEGRKEGNQDQLPVKAKKKGQKIVYRVGLIMQKEGKVAFVKRPSDGLLANMWELPSLESENPLSNQEWQEKIKEEFGIELTLNQPWMTIDHIFSHLKWKLVIYRVDDSQPLANISKQSKNWNWMNQSEIEKLSFPKAYKQVIDLLWIE